MSPTGHLIKPYRSAYEQHRDKQIPCRQKERNSDGSKLRSLAEKGTVFYWRMTTSTRLFFWRPSAVLLSATGSD